MRIHPLPLLVVLLCAGCSAERKDIIPVDRNDAEMNAAIKEAQRTLPQFWSQLDREGDGFSGLLKVFFTDPGDDEGGEHMWVRVTARSEEEVRGILLDTPGWLKSVKCGDQVRFPTGRITDWLYVENGKARGAFTEKLLRRRLSPAERREHDEGYPFSFD